MGMKQKDIEGQCNAHLHISDDFGDTSATMRCGLAAGHEGMHCEVFHSLLAGSVNITWEKDSRPECCEGYEFKPEEGT